jgi:hypothetical protein
MMFTLNKDLALTVWTVTGTLGDYGARARSHVELVNESNREHVTHLHQATVVKHALDLQRNPKIVKSVLVFAQSMVNGHHGVYGLNVASLAVVVSTFEFVNVVPLIQLLGVLSVPKLMEVSDIPNVKRKYAVPINVQPMVHGVYGRNTPAAVYHVEVVTNIVQDSVMLQLLLLRDYNVP